MDEKTLQKLLLSREDAEKNIQERIDKGQKLRKQSIESQDQLEAVVSESKNWSKYNTDLLTKLFDSTRLVEEYVNFNFLDLDRDEMDYLHYENYIDNYKDYFGYKINEYRTNMAKSISSLESIRDRLELFEESDPPERIFGEKIFIVHGHNEGAKHKIARFIEDLDLTAIILDEQPIGHTIIDKFEEHAGEAGFAIILLTGDDIGAPKDQKDNLQPRARQNVILEFGYFLGELGRKRIGVLYEEDVELPSDIAGLEYIPLDNAGGWKIKLAKGIRDAGFTVDMNKI